MGHKGFHPARVRQTAQMLLETKRMKTVPPYLSAIGSIPPSEAAVRTQPVEHHPTHHIKKGKKPKRLFQPQQIVYPEDRMRSKFFTDHPWELARPRTMLEDDGRDHERWDWSKGFQPGRPSTGEGVVQRQRWLESDQEESLLNPEEEMLSWMRPDPLLETKKTVKAHAVSEDRAYDQARKELYEHRLYDQVEARIAKEEAEAVGAEFGMTANEVGMELEKRTFDQFRAWAEEQVVIQEQARNAAYTGGGPDAMQESEGTTSDAESMDPSRVAGSADNMESAVGEVVSGQIPASRRGQEARGGAVVHP